MLLGKFSPVIGSTMFRSVCLGGTFDGIHAGHKLLFNEATKICRERLVVGVTDGEMIKRKILWELITPVEERIQAVKGHLHQINPNLNSQVVPINDLYGPTITDKDLECIVVSEETVKGANMINEARRSKGWNELAVHVVDLMQDTNETNKDAMQRLKEKKLSSSLFRVKKLGSIINPPIPNESIPKRPYLIGLTGGIASGKTAIGQYLKSKGFGYLSCDLLAQKTYQLEEGSEHEPEAYKAIRDYFGDGILNPQTKQIDRAKLGPIVFSDREKLNKLQSFVWPPTFKMVDEEIEKLKVKHDVIILENALLVETKQTERVHQVWTSIIPPEEAIKRQIESRGLSREEAEKRVNFQKDNLSRVKISNAVFCTLWEPDFTHQQIDKCIKELREKYL